MLWTTPVNYSSGSVLTAAELNTMQDNLRALKDPPSNMWVMDATKTSVSDASPVAVSDVEGEGKFTLTTTGGDILFMLNLYNSNSVLGRVTVSIDGTAVQGGLELARGNELRCSYVHTGLAAGSHIFRLMFWAVAATITFDHTLRVQQWSVRELS